MKVAYLAFSAARNSAAFCSSAGAEATSALMPVAFLATSRRFPTDGHSLCRGAANPLAVAPSKSKSAGFLPSFDSERPSLLRAEKIGKSPSLQASLPLPYPNTEPQPPTKQDHPAWPSNAIGD